MKMKNQKQKKAPEMFDIMYGGPLYPVMYNGKSWKKKDCDDIFKQFYHSRFSLNAIGGVYLAERVWIYPDGTMDEW